jgi:SAM-dependent methyltransferase
MYKNELAVEAAWLDQSVSGKVESIEILLHRNRIAAESILELGCGTGAILRLLEQRKIASRYYGIDFSQDAISFLRTRSTTIQAATGDITESFDLFGRNSFDVVIISHVLEHLEDPLSVLRSLEALQFSYLICEVPLENLLFGKVKARFLDRSRHPAGHIQFFNKQTFKELLSHARFSIMDERIYSPVLSHSTIRDRYGAHGKIHLLHKFLTERYLPKLTSPLWSRYYHAHYTTLSNAA